jgi:predicted dehydrogenase
MDAGIGNKKIILEKPIVPEINAIAEEQNSFVDSIMNGKPVAVTVEEAAEALRIAEMIMKQM